MLTKDLLEYRARKGQVHPKMLGSSAPELALAEALIARLTAGIGEPRGVIESELGGHATGYKRPRIAKGLVKLLIDRAEFEEPDPSAQDLRTEWLAVAETVREQLPSNVTFEAYEAALNEQFDLADVRDRLYQDLPERRPLVTFKPIDAAKLLARYDLAQVQGLLIHAERLVLRVEDGDTPELRRVLRWMRFCRLVADVVRQDDEWSMAIEGPAAVLDGAKKYGLQLATFFLVVPTLTRWRLEAEIKMPRRPTWQLALSHEAGLKPGLEGGAGHVPPEMRVVVDKWSDPDWRLDPQPPPQPIGVNGWCVPDMAAQRGEHSVAIELFHAWHAGALPRRLAELEARPRPGLVLGVDRKLSKKLNLDVSGPQLFEFSGFPTERGLKRVLASWWQAFGDG